MNGYRILAFAGNRWPVDLAPLGQELALRGFTLEIGSGGGQSGAGIHADAFCLVLAPSPAASEEAALLVAAAEHGIPALIVGQSWLPDRLQVDEVYPKGARHRPTRLRRIWNARAATVTADLVEAALVGLPAREPAGAASDDAPPPIVLAGREDPFGDALAGLAGEPSAQDFGEIASRLAAQRGRTIRVAEPGSRASFPSGAVVCAFGGAPEGWAALAAGHEVIACGAAPYAGLGVTFDATGEADLAAAFAAILDRGERRNRRDLTRRLLATEILFGSVAAAPAALASAIAEAAPQMSDQPRVSVSIVVNSHNYSRYLRDAIDSALDQTLPAREVVVVDDGSTDGSADIVRATSGIVPVLKPNGGQASALNAGLARAGGDVVVFLDADDRLHPNAVERIAAAWRPGLSRLQYGLETIDTAGRSTGLYPGSRAQRQGDLSGAVLARGIYPFMPTSGSAYDRTALARAMPIPEPHWRISADLYLALLTPFLGPVGRVQEVLGQYRVHGRNAHYHVLGSEPFRAPALLPPRIAAWQDLLDRIGGLVDGGSAALGRMRLHRRLLLAAFDRRIALRPSPWRETLRAFGLALREAGMPLHWRIQHASLPLRLWYSRLLRRPSKLGTAADVLPWPWPDPAATDFASLGGRSTWPILDHGTTTHIADFVDPVGILGWGWELQREGAVLSEPAATLAFTLPEPPANWRVELDVEPEDGVGRVAVEIECNGAPLDSVVVTESALLRLYVPDALLDRKHRGGRACCLTLRIHPSSSGARLRLNRVGVDLAPLGTSRPAPLLPSGLDVAVGRGSPYLSTGWDWPGHRGALASEAEARLVFATALCEGRAMLRLRIESRTAAGHPVVPAIRINGSAAEGHISDDFRFLTIALEADRLPPDGIAELDLIAQPDPADAALPRLRLLGMRIDPLASAAGPAMLLDRRHHLNEVAWEEGIEHRGLMRSEAAAARMTDTHFELLLRPARRDRDLRLTLYLLDLRPDEARTPVSGQLRVEDSALRLALGGMNHVAMRIAKRDAADAIAVRFETDPPTSGFGVSWVAVSEVDDAVPDLPAFGDTEAYDADALYCCVTSPADWHPPSEGALWLTGQRGTLVIRCDAARSSALELTLLTVPETGQRIVIDAGGTAAESVAGGRETVFLALPEPPAEDTADGLLALTFTSNLLVNLGMLSGEADPAMLGGAVVRIAFVARREEVDRIGARGTAAGETSQAMSAEPESASA